MLIKKRKTLSIALSMFIALAIALLPGCEILNDLPPMPTDDPDPYAEESEPEPEPEEIEPAGPAAPELSAWEQRLATWPMGFGFANEEGSRLIYVNYDFGDLMDYDEEPDIPEEANEDPDYLSELDEKKSELVMETGFDPDVFSLAIGSFSEIKPITFKAWQNESAQNNNRDTAYNFNNLPGFVYAQKDWTLRKNKTYVLTNMGPLVESSIVLAPPGGWRGNTPPMAEETIDSIEKFKERGVVWGKTLAVTKVGEGQIGIVMFERQGDEMMFSIVYMNDKKMLFWDCPAKYDESSTWRIDGGEDPGSFEPLFLARFDEGLLLMLTWGAAEGEIILLLREERGVFVQTEVGYGRYWG